MSAFSKLKTPRAPRARLSFRGAREHMLSKNNAISSSPSLFMYGREQLGSLFAGEFAGSRPMGCLPARARALYP